MINQDIDTFLIAKKTKEILVKKIGLNIAHYQ